VFTILFDIQVEVVAKHFLYYRAVIFSYCLLDAKLMASFLCRPVAVGDSFRRDPAVAALVLVLGAGLAIEHFGSCSALLVLEFAVGGAVDLVLWYITLIKRWIPGLRPLN
jgi:hypothetical protein